VNDFPDPVMPSSVWNRSPASSPWLRDSIAAGWSPAGAKSDTKASTGVKSDTKTDTSAKPSTDTKQPK